MQTYDVLVLGGGTAGTAAAKAAVQAGARVAMFNDGELGGLCILRGCMPTKTMLHAAHLRHEAEHHRTPGIAQETLVADFPEVMRNKDLKVARFKRAKISGIEGGGYEVIDARARFAGPDTVEANGETYRFTRGAVIAVGSNITIPPIEGIEEVPYWTSDDIMALTEQPDSVAVIGSGAIGLELAQFLARMGTQVELVSRRPVFADWGASVADEVAAILEDEPRLHNHSPATPVAVRHEERGIALEVEKESGKETIRAKHLLVATGRRAAVDDLQLEQAGIEMDRGQVKTNSDLRTTNPKVFVAGDATGDRLLLHVANWEGVAAGQGAAEVEEVEPVEQRLNMSVVFTDPPLASIGMTEQDAEQEGIAAITAEARFPETGRAITMDVAHGVMRLVASADRGEILGAQILGPRADDLVHVVSSIMYYRGTAKDMLAMPWYHPTLSEVLLSLARSLDAQVP
ncbi:MAG: dihydrolipoyl dehydrogenase family protein [Planctomycetota bacterium]|jgi:pyruvate/2-oxoglutarate dehydrogenase complex dihydrolipoamide dehydrogenase (E3) component